MSLDPTGKGRKGCTNRWKAALNAFDGRLGLDEHPQVIAADEEHSVDAREGRLDGVQPAGLRVVQVKVAHLDPALPQRPRCLFLCGSRRPGEAVPLGDRGRAH
jgi:hypothetical protein